MEAPGSTSVMSTLVALGSSVAASFGLSQGDSHEVEEEEGEGEQGDRASQPGVHPQASSMHHSRASRIQSWFRQRRSDRRSSARRGAGGGVCEHWFGAHSPPAAFSAGAHRPTDSKEKEAGGDEGQASGPAAGRQSASRAARAQPAYTGLISVQRAWAHACLPLDRQWAGVGSRGSKDILAHGLIPRMALFARQGLEGGGTREADSMSESSVLESRVSATAERETCLSPAAAHRLAHRLRSFSRIDLGSEIESSS